MGTDRSNGDRIESGESSVRIDDWRASRRQEIDHLTFSATLFFLLLLFVRHLVHFRRSARPSTHTHTHTHTHTQKKESKLIFFLCVVLFLCVCVCCFSRFLSSLVAFVFKISFLIGSMGCRRSAKEPMRVWRSFACERAKAGLICIPNGRRFVNRSRKKTIDT